MLLVLGPQFPSLVRKPRSYKPPGQKKNQLPKALRYPNGMALTMLEVWDRSVLAVLGSAQRS